jgi:hypothetical protein
MDGVTKSLPATRKLADHIPATDDRDSAQTVRNAHALFSEFLWCPLIRREVVWQ